MDDTMIAKGELITVTKTVCEKVPADTVNIAINAVGESKKYAEAIGKADRIADSTISALKAAGFKNIRAGGVNVAAVREDKSVIGYRAARNFIVDLPFDKKSMNAMLEIMTNSVCDWRVSFSLSDTGRSQELVTRAVRLAKESAATIAAAAGVELGGLEKAEYSSAEAEPPMLMRAQYGAASADPELITLSETVTCSWRIKRSGM